MGHGLEVIQMVKIPERNDPTITAMKAAMVEIDAKKPKRGYLGASSIGAPCARKVWYQYKGYAAPPFDAETLMNFDDGHRTEELTAARLRLVPGIELWTHDDNGKQFGFSIFNGEFRGHCDGVIRGLIQAPKSNHVWECKAANAKKYAEFQSAKAKWGEKLALKNWNETYFIQAQLYMHFLKIDRHYLTVALAGGRDYDSCRTEYEPDKAEWAIDRAAKIIAAKEPPPKINEKPDFYICRFCNYREECHGVR
jgi:hypothetical protein